MHNKFIKILANEERAKHIYDHYIEQIDDDQIKLQLIEIRDDEVKHIEIAKKLLDISSR
ncbi:MAG: hypothetical protein P9M03_03930 [Candidatus Theseobacter exili]|nr:hypothetical protein [Candidatus Theseobacter exili]